MSEHRPDPALPPRLHAVPPGTVPPLSAASEPGTSAALVPPASAAPLTVADRAATVARIAADAARELWLNPGRLLYVLWNGKPESMAEHFAYMKSGAWVPEEIDGSPAKALIIAGLAFHLIVAWPLKAAAKSLDAAASRPLRFVFLVALVLILFLIFGIL